MGARDELRKVFATAHVNAHSRVMEPGERIDEMFSPQVLESLVKRGLARVEDAIRPKQKADKAAEPAADEKPAE